MTTILRGQGTLEDHTRHWLDYDERDHRHFSDVPQGRYSEEIRKTGNAPYTSEDMLLDQLEQLPSAEQVSVLVKLLRAPELREIAAGVIIDVTTGCKVSDSLEVAKAVNGWIATAEEIVTSRRKLRHILAARQSFSNQLGNNS